MTDPVCSFCGATLDGQRSIVVGPAPAAICSECAALAVEALRFSRFGELSQLCRTLAILADIVAVTGDP